MKLSKLLLERDSLDSQIVRNFLGERTFDDLSTSFAQQPGLLGFLVDTSKKFGGWLIAGLNFIGWSVGTILEWAITQVTELVTFDWEQTDEEIRESIAQSNKYIGNQWGQFAGRGLVWLVSIGLAKGLTVKFPVMAGRLALTLAEEGGQDLKGSFLSSLSVSAEETVNVLALAVYGYSRSVIRDTFFNDAKAQKIKENKTLKQIFKVGKTVWKYIPFKNLIKGFIQGLFEGAIDGLYDVAYTISFSIDDHFQAIREAQNSTENEPTRTVEILPEGEDSKEKIILQLPQERAEVEIQNYLQNHSLVENRDLGTVVGEPYADWYHKAPQQRKLVIEFLNRNAPPFYSRKTKLTRVQISIPDAKKGIDWTDLKTKIKKYTWGGAWCKIIFTNRRFMMVWGATRNEAEQQALSLAKLSTLEILQTSFGEIERQNPKRKKRPTVVYPCFAMMLVRKSSATADTSTIDGKNLAMAKTRVPIWKDEKPSDFAPLK